MIHARLLEKTIIAVTIITSLFILSGCVGSPSHNINRPIMELNTDRPGADIKTIRLSKAKPQLCSEACHFDSKCVAWTYVKPGIISADAHCRTKSQISSPKRSSCCISGLK